MNSVAHDRYTYALSVDANKKPLELLLLLEQPPPLLLMMTLRTYGWALNGARVGHAEKGRRKGRAREMVALANNKG